MDNFNACFINYQHFERLLMIHIICEKETTEMLDAVNGNICWSNHFPTEGLLPKVDGQNTEL
jgi:hypothetical protein